MGWRGRRRERWSVQRTGRLDDRRPARDLALHQFEQRLLATLWLVGDHAAELQKPLARGLVVERLVEGVAELVDDGLGRGLGREQRVPGVRCELRQNGLLGGR